jgi:hypothetical protein
MAFLQEPRLAVQKLTPRLGQISRVSPVFIKPLSEFGWRGATFRAKTAPCVIGY